MNRLNFLALILILVSNLSYADSKESYEKFLADKAVIIDVREKEEVQDGVIKGAAWFPLSSLENGKKSEIQKIKKLSKDKEIYLYCRTGNRSGKYQTALEKAGVKSKNLGGYPELVKNGLPTQTSP